MAATSPEVRDPGNAGPLTVRLVVDARGEPERIGPYRVIGVLGRGGMGTVYEVVDEAGGVFALKIVELRFLQMPEIQAGRRFTQEISVLATLGHPSVVRMFAYGYARHPSGSEQAFFVMERVYGETLDKLIGREHVFRDEEAVRIVGLLAHAVGYLDRQGVIHRDIKPANVLIDPSDRVVLMDFGLARSEEHTRLTRAGQIIGTLAYMSPERLCGLSSDVSSDVYALGVVLYEMLTGAPPFNGQDPTDLVQRITRGVSFPADFKKRPHGAELEALLAGMLNVAAKERFDPERVVEACLEIHPLDEGTAGTEPTIADLARWRGTGTLTSIQKSSPAVRASIAPMDTKSIERRPTPRQASPASPPQSLPETVTSMAGRLGPSWPLTITISAFTFAAGILLGGVVLRRPPAIQAALPPTQAALPPTPSTSIAPTPVVVSPAEPTFTDSDAAFEYGDRAAKEGRSKSAVRAFERAIELNPVHAEAYRRLGDVLAASGDQAAALKRYDTFLKLRPDAPEAGELRKLIGKP